jgi:hypothetical protein
MIMNYVYHEVMVFEKILLLIINIVDPIIF